MGTKKDEESSTRKGRGGEKNNSQAQRTLMPQCSFFFFCRNRKPRGTIMKKLVAKRKTKKMNQLTRLLFGFYFFPFLPYSPNTTNATKRLSPRKVDCTQPFREIKKCPFLFPAAHIVKKISRKRATIKLFPTKRASLLILKGYLRVMSGRTAAIKFVEIQTLLPWGKQASVADSPFGKGNAWLAACHK